MTGEDRQDRLARILGEALDLPHAERELRAEFTDLLSREGEANNLVFTSLAALETGRRVVTTSVEHSSVIKMCEHLESRGAEVTYLPVDSDGLVDSTVSGRKAP